ncbi:MAG: hypothetical protein ACREJX_20900 [Polyangiaceae bacterium]
MQRLRLGATSVLLASWVLSLSACSPYTNSTVVEVRDPTLVRYATAGGPIPVSSRTNVIVADHDIIYRGDRFAELVVTARETPNGSLVTSWRSDPAIWTGDRVVGIGNEGLIVVPDRARIQNGEVTIPICGRFDDLGSRTGRARASPVTSVSIGVPCDQLHDVAIWATTPLSNVRSVNASQDSEKPL